MNTRIWLALCGAMAALFVTIGSLNAESLSDADQDDDISAKIVNNDVAKTEGLNLTEQNSNNFYYYGAGYYYPYSYMSYYPYYSYFPYYSAYSYYPYYSYYTYPYYGYYTMPFTRTTVTITKTPMR